MSVVDLKCQESFSFPPSCDVPGSSSGTLLLGNQYQVFLYFGLPPCIGLQNLTHARVILFKIPLGNAKSQTDRASGWYAAYPLRDFCSAYSPLYSPPRIYRRQRAIFKDRYDLSYTEIDVTGMVKAWMGEKFENKGILLTGSEDTRSLTYASELYKVKGMRPMMRLHCEEIEICRPLSVSPCTVKLE